MQATHKKNTPARERSDLDRCYGKIGIPAVAAALRYQGDAKNPAYAPVTLQPQHEREEAEA